MIVRTARLEDAGAIAAIHVRAWQAAYKGLVPESFLEALSVDERERAWRQRLVGSGPRASVLEEHGEVLGWVSVGPSRDTGEPSSTSELWAIYVEPTHWRRGVGQRLWDDVEKQLQLGGVSDVTLWVLKGNTRALAFYRSNGFVADPGIEKTVEIGGTDLVEVRLRKGLSGRQR